VGTCVIVQSTLCNPYKIDYIHKKEELIVGALATCDV